MKDLRLVYPCEEYMREYLALCVECREQNVSLGAIRDPDRFAEWGPTLVRECEDARHGRNLPEGYVPGSIFWAMEGDTIIGVGSLRHTLNDSLREIGGHIGYLIRPSKWQQGYGTRQLKLLLDEAAKLGIERALVSCDVGNTGSARVMEKNGGVLEGVFTVEFEGKAHTIKRYWIDTPAAANCYLKTAHLYDFNNSQVMTEDVPFYLDLAARTGGDILELACGTGRVTIPLVEAGHCVTGLDLSPAMLRVLEEKRQSLGEAGQRLALVQANMCHFHLDRQFDLIMIPFRAFQGLVEEADALACLETVRAHLKEDGLFTLNVFRPYKQLGQDWCYPEMLQWERDDPATGRHIVKKTANEAIDTEKQVIYPFYAYEVRESDGHEYRVEERLRLKYYYDGQIRSLAERAGFHIREEYGWYDGSPIEGEREIIFVCGKARD